MNASRAVLGLGVALAANCLTSSTWAFSEAPSLAAQVREGKLPAVDKRLPDKPEVIRPFDQIGSYGGTFHSAVRANGDVNGITRLIGAQGLTRWSPDFATVIPNVAESWAQSKDAKEFVFRLRHGMKWSDGAPFTADDVLFAINDLVANKQFFPSTPALYVVADKPVLAEKIDDYTVRLRFNGAYHTFIEQLATPMGQHPTLYPRHYCGQFHPKYNPGVEELVKQANVSDWVALMRLKCGDTEAPTRWSNLDKPTLDPWILETTYGSAAMQVRMKRNPYFWQVDSAGNQLPYIDELQLPIISEPETILLTAMNGQLDFQVRHIQNIQNRPVLAENAAKGHYKVIGLNDVNASAMAIFFNQSTQNSRLRPLFRSHEFRAALSLAMNRREINDIVFLGQSQPWQIGPAHANRFFNEKLATQYTDFELQKANQMLDQLGLTRRDSSGYRLYADGSRISMGAIVSISMPYQIQVLELLRNQWAKAGIELVIRSSERSLFYDRANSNDYDISVDGLAGGYDPTQNPRAFLAIHPQESRQSLPWVRWYASHGKQGEEPPASMKKRLELYDRWKDARTDAEADALFRQILAISADELEVLGTVTPTQAVGVRSNRLGNFFDKMPWGWTYPTPGPGLTQQWYLKN